MSRRRGTTKLQKVILAAIEPSNSRGLDLNYVNFSYCFGWLHLFFFCSSKSTKTSTKNSGHTQFFIIFRLVHMKFLVQNTL
ncbi:hypothetical protein B566_EDAN015361 [Ephemera danica]|nr:hypothetical protein B566_EDAN015361 [Ephemera danica]